MFRNRLINRLLAYFIRGLVFVSPIYFTLLIIVRGIQYLDNILPIYIPTGGDEKIYLPGVGLLLIVGGIVALGFVFSRYVPQSFFGFMESLLKKLPLVSLIYYSIKDLITAFVGDKRKFNQPVLVIINQQSDIRKLGFVTQTDLKNLQIEGYVGVYCPHSYAFSGEFYIVPSSHVKVLDHLSSADVMKMIVSGGVSMK